MKTPEEIKKGLECCGESDCHHSWKECTYWKEVGCTTLLMKDALAYIRQLEAQISEANGKIKARDKEIDRMSLSFTKQTLEVAEYKLFLLKSVENATGSLRKWISVKERLPEGEDPVLILVKETEHYGLNKEKRKVYFCQYLEFMRRGINRYLGTKFTVDDFDEIYTYLGNGCNRAKTLRFIESGYDLSVLHKRKEG